MALEERRGKDGEDQVTRVTNFNLLQFTRDIHVMYPSPTSTCTVQQVALLPSYPPRRPPIGPTAAGTRAVQGQRPVLAAVRCRGQKARRRRRVNI